MSEDVIVPSEERELEQDFMDLINEVPIEEAEVEAQADEVVEPEVQAEEVVAEEDAGPDWEALYKEEEQRRKTVEGRFKKARDDWKQKEETVPVDEPKPVSTEDHKEFWETYEEMFAPVQALIGKMIDERIADITPKLEVLDSKVESTTLDAHYSAIAAAHPDWKDLGKSQDLQDWMNSLPYTTTEGLDGATAWTWFNEGNAQEVIQLFSAYKESRTRKTDVEIKTAETPKPDTLVEKVIAAAAVESDSGSPIVQEQKANKSFADDFNSFL